MGSPSFFSLKRGDTVNTATYCAMISRHLDWLRANFTPEELQGGLWLQDSARPHTSRETLAFLRQELRQLGLRLIPPKIWPPKSPDLNVMDYCVWNPIKKEVQGAYGCPVAQIRAKMMAQWRIQMEDRPHWVKKVARRLRSRCERVIAAEGAWIS